MNLIGFRTFFLRCAPGFLGAFFLAGIATSCREKRRIPDWQSLTPPSGDSAHAAAPHPPAHSKAKPSRDPAAQVRFVAYNVENWLTMQPAGKKTTSREKPEKERSAVATMILGAKPDVIGICEIGGEAEVADLQQRLSDGGNPLEYHVLVGGTDPERKLALLSRFPIEAPTQHDNLTFTVLGKPFGMQRSILDAVVETPAGDLRFVGVHLKSKRDVEGEDQGEMRRQEAHLLRRELDRILTDDPQARLIVYGDMNDTRQSPAIRAIQGPTSGPASLYITPLKDSRGETWTQHWAFEEIYSHIDYVMLSSSLKSAFIANDSQVLDDPIWSQGSDHRPLLVVLGATQ